MIWNVEKNKQTHERRNLFMKKVTKLFLSVAAISALAAGLATSAMAMTASYDATAGTVTITAEEGDLVASSEKTLLILNNDAVTVTEADIVQIDQSEDIAEVPVGELADGTYYVRVGGDGHIDKAEFTVGGESPYENPARLLGDVDNDTYINMADTDGIIGEFLSAGTLTGDDLQAADTDEDLFVNMADTDAIIAYFLDATTADLGTKTLADRTAAISEAE